MLKVEEGVAIYGCLEVAAWRKGGGGCLKATQLAEGQLLYLKAGWLAAGRGAAAV